MSKLSRRRARKDIKTPATAALDDSDSDFSSLCTPILPVPTNGTQASQPGRVNSHLAPDIISRQSSSIVPRSAIFEETVEEAVDEAVETSVCPVCGKLGAGGAHVKVCGSRHGLSTAALLEAVKLSERQGKERKALGLPLAPIQEKARAKVTKSKQGKRVPKEDGGADPDLAIGLALSISAMQHQQIQEDEKEPVVSKYFDNEAKDGGKEAVIEEGDREKEGRMWLPQASSSPHKKKKRGRRKGGGKETTVLQLRTEEERSRLLGEKVSETLINESTVPGLRMPIGACKYSMKLSHFWLLPAKLDTLGNQNLTARGLSRFISPSNNFEGVGKEERAQSDPSPGSLASLSTAWLSLLKTGAGADTVFLCKGEAELCCHSLVLTTRSPKILSNAVQETSEDGKTKHMLILTEYEVTAVQFLLRFIYGGVMDSAAVTSRDVFAQVGKLARMWGLLEVVRWLEQVEVQEEEGAEELGEQGDGFAVGLVEEDEGEEGGTQCLNALLDHLEEGDGAVDSVEVKEGNEGEDEMEEWDSVCQYMTQRMRNSIVEGKDDNTEEELQSLDGESSHEGLEQEIFEDDFDAVTENEHLGIGGRAPCDNTSDKENKSPSDTSPLASLKPIPCFALLEQSSSLPLPAPNPSNSSTTPSASSSSSFSSVHGNASSAEIDERSFLKTQVSKSYTPSASQLACPPSPDMFDSEGEEEVQEEDYEAKIEAEGEEGDGELSSSQKRKSNLQIETEAKRVKKIQSDLLGEKLPTKYTPAPYTPLPILSRSPVERDQDPAIDLTQSSTSSQDGDEDDDLELPTPTKYSPFPKKVNALQLSHSAEKPPHLAGAAPVPMEASTMEEDLEASTLEEDLEEDEDGVLAELSLLTARLSAKGATEEEISACLVCLLSLQVTVPALLATGAGKVVKKMREKDGEIGKLASTLVRNWKQVVEEYPLLEVQGNTGEEKEKLERTGLYSQGEAVIVKKEEYDDDSDGADMGVSFADAETRSKLEPSQKIEVEDSPEWEDSIPQPDSPDARLDLSELKMGNSPPPWEDPPDFENLDGYDNYALAEDPEVWNSCNEPRGSESPPRDPPPALPQITPVDRRLTCLRRREDTACTPLPDYTAMLSPQLREELTRFGLKAVPRRKATLLLNHIYEKTHPLVAITPQAASPLSSHRRSMAKASARRISTTASRTSAQVRGERSKKEERRKIKIHVEEERSKQEDADMEDEGESQASSQASQYSDAGLAEESILEGGEEEKVELSLDQQLSSFIRTRPSLHQQVLEYEPLWLHKFHQDTKEAGIKCNLAQVQQYLDLHCICFRTETKRPNRQKSPKKKKKSPVKRRTPKKKSPKKKKPSEAGPSVTPVKRARTVATSSKFKKRCLITP